MTNDLVSIVMPMYNTAPYVGDAIKSVLQQKYPNFELIVIDDGSTDGGHEVVQRYSDRRISLIQTENRGLSAARNLGVNECRGTFVTFLDSDDMLTPGSLTSRLEPLTETRAEVAFSQNIIVTDITNQGGFPDLQANKTTSKPWKIWKANELLSMLIEGTFFTFSQSFLIERSLYQRIGGFNPEVKVSEDVEFITRLLPAVRNFAETFSAFYVYRRRMNSLSSINSRLKATEALRSLRMAHHNLSPYLNGREGHIAQSLFSLCVQDYPYWTQEHHRAMAEARRLRGGKPFDLSCVGGPKARAVARLLGWRIGRLETLTSSYVKRKVRYFLQNRRSRSYL